jgi:AAA-like domain
MTTLDLYEDQIPELVSQPKLALNTMPRDALELVHRILAPKRLSYIQELVFLQAWTGKIYREIAADSGYDLDYIKEVGSQLWSAISEALGEKVSKKNVRLVLANYSVSSGQSVGSSLQFVTRAPDSLEFPSDAVPLQSKLYIERPPVEERAFAEINRPGSLTRIKAPRQMGKTSLVLRILAHARESGLRPVMVNLQQAESPVLLDLSRFLRWFCVYVGQRLNLESRLDEYWDDEVGSKVSCTTYFQQYLLRHVESPVVLALDEVNRIFEYPELAQEFLPLLRTWHEEAAEQEVWQKLRIVIVHSTEIYVPLKLSQSPFNVGLPIQLQEFDLNQVHNLAQRYGLDDDGIEANDLQPLLEMVGGHPHLVQLALYWLRQRDVSPVQLLQEAATQAGIYRDHLLRHLGVLHQNPELESAYRQVVHSDEGVQLEAIAAYRLESMGLVKVNGNRVMPSCELYRRYFRAQLPNGRN